MVWILKAFLLLVAVALGFAVNYMYVDFTTFKKMDEFDEMNLWNKTKIRLVLIASILSTITLIGLLLFFIISKITIG